jgi:hypothetical protein
MTNFFKKFWDYLNTKKGAWIFLIAIYLACVLMTALVINSNAHGLTHFNDEIIYWRSIKALYDGMFTIKDFHHYPPLYYLLLLPAFYLAPSFQTYALLKLINVLWVTSVIFPAYLILRKFLDRRSSLIGAALLLVYPIQVVMPRLLLSENVFYPLFLWAMLFAFTDVFREKNGLFDDVALGILLGLLTLTRFITIAIIPAFVLIWWIKPRQAEGGAFFSKQKFLRLVLIGIITLLLEGVWIIAGLRESVPLFEMLGFSIAAVSNPAQLTLPLLIMWAFFYLAYMLLIAAPYLFLLLSAKIKLFKEWREDHNRWMIAVLAMILFFMIACARHSWKAVYNYPDPAKLQGRYVLVIGPLLLMSVFIEMRQMIENRDKKLWVGFLASNSLVVFSYFLLFKKIAFFDYNLNISRSSPFGYLVMVFDEKFLIITAVLSVIFWYVLKKRHQIFIYVFTACIAIFFLAGDYLIFRDVLTPAQQINNQIVQTIRAIRKSDAIFRDFQDDPIGIMVNQTVTTNQVHKWEYALQVNGFSNFTLVVDTKNELGNAQLFRFIFGGNQVSLWSANEIQFEDAECYKFSIDREYYLIPEVPGT